jgi:hypothetical protein
MFCWVTIHLDALPRFRGKKVSAEDAKKVLNELWIALADAKVLVAPGWMFAGDGLRSGAPDDDSFAPAETESPFGRLSGLEDEDVNKIGHFRLAFATLEEGPMREVRHLCGCCLPCSLLIPV